MSDPLPFTTESEADKAERNPAVSRLADSLIDHLRDEVENHLSDYVIFYEEEQLDQIRMRRNHSDGSPEISFCLDTYDGGEVRWRNSIKEFVRATGDAYWEDVRGFQSDMKELIAALQASLDRSLEEFPPEPATPDSEKP